MSSSPAHGSIVVGIDGSDGADRGLAWAVEQARLEKRPLCLVHGVDPHLRMWAGEPGFDIAGVVRLMTEDGRALLDKAGASIASDVVVRTVLREEDPCQALLDLSADAWMIVLGSRGRGPVRSLVLGSVGIAVMQHARCPVVVLRPGRASEEDAPAGSVVVGVAGTGSVGRAVEVAFRQASLRALPLTVVHGAWNPLQGIAGDAVRAAGPWERAETERVEVTLAGLRERFPDVVVTYRTAEGLPDDCLVAESRGNAMVVVATLQPGGAASLFAGNVARSVTEHARCPVLLVPEGPPLAGVAPGAEKSDSTD